MRPVRLFVYGSLLAPAVLQVLLRRRVQPLAARLPGYRRRALRGQVFPGIVPATPATTCGAVVAISRRELRVLDRYEDDFFERLQVIVVVDGDRPLRAQTYRLRRACRSMGGVYEWTPQTFQHRHAAALARRARGHLASAAAAW